MKGKKNLDTEVNLIAFISLLSVLICSLLLSVIWVQIGSLNIKQAVGGQSSKDKEKVPVVWVDMLKKGGLQLKLQDAPRAPKVLKRISVQGLDGKIDFDALGEKIVQIQKALPKLKMALIRPQAKSDYEEVIGLMDQFKKAGINDLGLNPL